ncbi:hypothetical protein V8E54_000847 [Elaphomyces granulatus]
MIEFGHGSLETVYVPAFRIDVLIYTLAIRQEGPYQEALAGVTPSYPADVLQMENGHWRNDEGPYWMRRTQGRRRASDNGRQRASDNGRQRAPYIGRRRASGNKRQVIEVEGEVGDEEYGEEGEEGNEEEIFYETEDNVIELTPSRQIPELSDTFGSLDCIHIRKIHEYIHGYIHIRVSMRTPRACFFA